MVQVAVGARVAEGGGEGRGGGGLGGAGVGGVAERGGGAVGLGGGMGRRSCVSGGRGRRVRGRPVPVRVKGEGVPEVVEERVRVAVRGPAMAGVNWTPSQQLVQGPVKVAAKVPV